MIGEEVSQRSSAEARAVLGGRVRAYTRPSEIHPHIRFLPPTCDRSGAASSFGSSKGCKAKAIATYKKEDV